MAKKNFDMGKLSLQGKKTLTKTEVVEPQENESIETAIQEIHGEEKPAPAPQPKPQPKPKAKAKVTELVEEPVKRITFDIPASLHMEIKLHCVRTVIPLKEFLLNSVLKEMKKTRR
jgi:hypothetical protein